MKTPKENLNGERTPKTNFMQIILRKINKNPLDFILIFVLLFFIVFALYQNKILGWTEWTPGTGFGGYLNEEGKFVRGKTLWDLLELLLIPIGGAYIAFRFSKTLKKTEQTIADEHLISEQELLRDRQREDALQNYIGRMSELMLNNDHGLRNSMLEDEVRVVARTITITTLRMLDGIRKGLLLQFLKEANLIERGKPIVSLENADFSLIEMRYGDLTNIELVRVDLSNSNFYNTNFSNSNLQYSNFSYSKMIDVNFSFSNLEAVHFMNSSLDGSFFNSSIMKSCCFINASLGLITMNDTNLEYVMLNNAKLYWVSIGQRNFDNVNFNNCYMQDGNFYDPKIHSLETINGFE